MTERYFEDFTIGDVYRHRLGRTVTETDNLLFTMLTLNTDSLHFDAHRAAKTPFGRIVVNSCFTLSLAVGLSVADLNEHGLVSMGWGNIELPSPVFIGDTIYASSEIVDLGEPPDRQDVGIVVARTTGRNQRDETVIAYERTFMVYKRGRDPRERR
ncbi:MAG: MaoC family dehydratase [Candidatus Eremiobacteraeota bacterium]|nr:MaoC family dehydratase [Candidatus Eremiobacteraeota bacterium]MBC5803023.1 MaoC family dehydratase [Candidatus Eremiobacteraeota bacterium]MBC5821344.1 MaoC family dehydratase [Candidatus Eremiobacteraeota bacterium]